MSASVYRVFAVAIEMPRGVTRSYEARIVGKGPKSAWADWDWENALEGQATHVDGLSPSPTVYPGVATVAGTGPAARRGRAGRHISTWGIRRPNGHMQFAQCATNWERFAVEKRGPSHLANRKILLLSLVFANPGCRHGPGRNTSTDFDASIRTLPRPSPRVTGLSARTSSYRPARPFR
jgi:hypothetical protein